MDNIAAPRIGTGKGYFIVGAIAFGLAVFAGLAAAGGGEGAGGFSVICLSLAVGSVVIGFWIKLFGAVERRLIDIQTAIVAGRTPSAAPAEPPSIVTGR